MSNDKNQNSYDQEVSHTSDLPTQSNWNGLEPSPEDSFAHIPSDDPPIILPSPEVDGEIPSGQQPINKPEDRTQNTEFDNQSSLDDNLNQNSYDPEVFPTSEPPPQSNWDGLETLPEDFFAHVPNDDPPIILPFSGVDSDIPPEQQPINKLEDLTQNTELNNQSSLDDNNSYQKENSQFDTDKKLNSDSKKNEDVHSNSEQQNPKLNLDGEPTSTNKTQEGVNNNSNLGQQQSAKDEKIQPNNSHNNQNNSKLNAQEADKASDNPNFFNQLKSESKDDIDHDSRKTKISKKQSLGHVAQNGLAKLSAKALETLLKMAKMLLALMLEMLKLILFVSPISRGLNSKYPSIPVVKSPFSGFANRIKDIYNQPPSLAASSGQVSQENQDKKLKEDLDKDLDQNNKINSLNNSKLEIDNPVPTQAILEKNKNFLVAKKLEELEKSSPDIEKLKEDAQAKVNSLSKEHVLKDIKSIAIKSEHNISPDLAESKNRFPPQSFLHTEFGVLLGKGDHVSSENVNYGVLSAYKVDDQLIYSLVEADQDNNNYSISLKNAKDITLLEHNKFSYDNEENLVTQVDQELLSSSQNEVAKLKIIDHNKPNENSLSPSELIEKTYRIDSFSKENNYLMSLDKNELTQSLQADTEFSKASLKEFSDSSKDFSQASKVYQNHPFFQELLNLNDLVTAKTNNGKAVQGDIVGAYSAQGELYYQIKDNQSNNTYNIQPKNINRLEIDGGSLGISELRQYEKMADLFASKKMKLDNIEQIHRHEKVARLPLIHKTSDEVFLKRNGISLNTDSVSENQKDLIFNSPKKTINLDFAGFKNENQRQIYTVTNPDTQKSLYFVSLGMAEKIDGNSKVLAVEVPTLNMKQHIQPHNSRILELDIDSPNVTAMDKQVITDKTAHFVDRSIKRLNDSFNNKLASALSRNLENHVENFLKNEAALLAEESLKQKIYLKTCAESLAQNIDVTKDLSIEKLGKDAHLDNTTIDVKDIPQQEFYPTPTVDSNELFQNLTDASSVEVEIKQQKDSPSVSINSQDITKAQIQENSFEPLHDTVNQKNSVEEKNLAESVTIKVQPSTNNQLELEISPSSAKSFLIFENSTSIAKSWIKEYTPPMVEKMLSAAPKGFDKQCEDFQEKFGFNLKDSLDIQKITDSIDNNPELQRGFIQKMQVVSSNLSELEKHTTSMLAIIDDVAQRNSDFLLTKNDLDTFAQHVVKESDQLENMVHGLNGILEKLDESSLNFNSNNLYTKQEAILDKIPTVVNKLASELTEHQNTFEAPSIDSQKI